MGGHVINDAAAAVVSPKYLDSICEVQYGGDSGHDVGAASF
jgi:hypothetical protein